MSYFIVIALGITITLTVLYAKFKNIFEYKTIEEEAQAELLEESIEKTKKQQNYLLYQIKTRLNIIIFIMLLPTILLIFLIILVLPKISLI